MSREKEMERLFNSCPFAGEIQLQNFIMNLQTAAELMFALHDEQMQSLGIPYRATFRRPDLYIMFQMQNTDILA